MTDELAPMEEWKFDLRMAVREARAQWARLLLVAACLGVGFAAFFATYGFSSRVTAAIKAESRSLLGGDAIVDARGHLPEDLAAKVLADPAVAAHARVLDFPTQGGTGAESEGLSRLLELRAVAGAYPLYGRLQLESDDAASALRRGALVEASLRDAWGLKVAADPALPGPELLARHEGLALGSGVVPVAGIVVQDDSRQSSAFSLGPRVLVSVDRAEALGLVGLRARVVDRLLLRLVPGSEAPALARFKALAKAAPLAAHLRVRGHEEAAGALAQPIRNVNRFIQQLGLATLLLAMLGGWAILAAFLEGRRRDAAVLRSLGAPPLSPFRTFGLLALGLLALALLGGGAVGLGLARWLPEKLADLIPAAVRHLPPAPPPLLETALALLLVVLLVLPTLLRLARVQPLSLLREGAEAEKGEGAGWLPALGRAVAFGIAVALVVRNAPTVPAGLVTAALLALLFLLLYGASRLLLRLFRRGSEGLPLSLRLALGQLGARPALTGLAMAVMGLSLFLLLAAQFIQRDLVAPILKQRGGAGGERPNVFLVDVQAEQADLVRGIVKDKAGRPPQEAPLVRARLSAIAGEPVVERPPAPGQEETQREAFRTREQNLSWRDALGANETLVAGRFWDPGWKPGGPPRAEVSLEEGFAKGIGAKLGDELAFDVQGVEVKGRVTSLRKVAWQTFAPSFFILVHPSLLEGAPAQVVMAVEIPAAPARAALQAALNRRVPNVSVIDITDLAARVDRVLDLVALVARSLAALMLGSSLLVLAASLLSGRLGRTRDLALLRTLGAGEGLLLRSLAWEFGLLGGASALVAAVLAGLGSSLYARKVLELPTESHLGLAAALLLLAAALTLALGFLTSLRALRAEPLAVLRGE